MGWGELAGRSRQQLWKWLERVGGPEPVPLRFAALDAARLRGAVTQRLLPGPSDPRTAELLVERMGGERDRVVAAAEDACRGRFDLLGYRGLRFGDPLDWRLDPVHGRRSPLVHWSGIDPLDAEAVGDSKVVWELNRHQWLVILGQAYRLTREERFARAAIRQLREWLSANPRPLGINWASSLEVALRLISWCWVAQLLVDSPALGDAELVELAEAVSAHAGHVERYLSHYFSPNTHLTGEALGLVYAGLVCRDHPAARRWLALGQRIAWRELERQVLADGVHFELSTCYHRYTVEIYLQLLVLARRNGLRLPPRLGARLRAMVDFLLWVRRPDGRIPMIGDADGGWLLPLVRRDADDCRGVFATAAALLREPSYAWAAQGEAPEPLWLLGEQGLREIARLAPAPPRAASRVFPQGGYAVLRSGWQREAHQLVFDVGPLGCPVSGGHGHADLLSIQCSAFGEAFLVDPGSFVYTGAPAWRDYFRSAAAHSTLTVDGVPLAVPAGPFAWRSRPRARLRRWRARAGHVVASGEHDAYLHLPGAVRHRRTVVRVDPAAFVIFDEVGGDGEHRLDLRFNFAPVRLEPEERQWLRARGSGGHGLAVRAFAAAPLELAVAEGCEAPIQGWLAPDYGIRQPAPSAVYSCRVTLPARLVTALVPLADAGAPLPRVEAIAGGAGGPLGLALADGRRVRLTADGVRVFSNPSRPRTPRCAPSPES